jgi:hypothetical protein
VLALPTWLQAELSGHPNLHRRRLCERRDSFRGPGREKIELNADDTPIGLLTLQKDLRVIKSRQSIDTNGMVFAPHQSPGVLLDCADRSPDEPTTMTTYTQKITFGEMRASGVRDVVAGLL